MACHIRAPHDEWLLGNLEQTGESIPKLGASQTVIAGSTALTWGARDSRLMSRMASLNIPTTARSRRCLKYQFREKGNTDSNIGTRSHQLTRNPYVFRPYIDLCSLHHLDRMWH